MKLIGRKRYSNQEIFAGIRDRDNKVVKFVIKESRDSVKRFVCSNKGTVEDTMQVIEDAIISIFEKGDAPVLTCKFSTYFFAICKNLWLMELRRRKRVDEPLCNPDLLPCEEVDESASQEVMRELYRRHFRHLSENCRKVLALVSQGITNEEITSELGFSSVQHTKNRKYRCIKSITSLIKSDPEFERFKNGLY